MNILHITTFLQGGAGQVVLDLTKGALKDGHTVCVACTKDAVDGYGNYPEYIDELTNLRVPLTFLHSTFSRNYGKNLQAVSTLLEQIRENPPDLIHSHSSIPSLVAMIASSRVSKRIPIIQTMHGWGIYKSAEQEVQDIGILNLADHVVSISKSSDNLLVNKGLSNPHRSVIYNGLPTTPSAKSQLEDEHLLQIRRLKKEGKKVLGIIGTVDARKNQSLVLEALSSLPRDLEINAFFIGEGQDLDSYRQKAEDLGLSKRVTFTGYKARARFFISEFDMLVSASRSEGATPLAVLEAFADKTLVLAADTPENKEAVEDSQNGFLFRSEDASDLSDKMEDCLLCEDSERITTSAHELFKNRYLFEKTCKSYLKLYELQRNKR